MANRPKSRALPIAAALLLGATAGAGVFFCLHWRLKESLMDGMSVNEPTATPRESAAEDEETVPVAAGPGKAETAAEAAQSARDGSEEIASASAEEPPAGAGGEDTGGADNRELPDLLESEARKAAGKLLRENAELRKRNAELARRNRSLGERLAEAMEALDRDGTRTMPEAEAAAPDVSPDGAAVLDVNAELGLVVVDRGGRDGLRYGLPMTVVRDRRKVARVRVVDVRERIAGAAVEDTVPGDWPQEGDRAVPGRPADSEGN